MKNVLIVSHERSGTHFLINTIAWNFGMSDQRVDVENKQSLERIYTHAEPRIYKAHHQYYWFMPHIKRILDNAVMFYIVRDGRDVMCSSWHYHRDTHKQDFFPRINRFSDWLRTDPREYPFDQPYSVRTSPNMARRWKTHTDSWSDKTFMNVITYEELSKQFTKTVVKIGEMIGAKPNGYKRPLLKNSRSVDPRKGIVGDYVNCFSKDDLAYFAENTK